MLGFPILYFKGMRPMMFQLSGFYYILWAQCIYIGTTLRPMYLLSEYMDP